MVEEHKDAYPHIHVILQYNDARIRISNGKYLQRPVYAIFKNRWKMGHSDCQVPLGKKTRILSYVLKYCLKNATHRTVWKKLMVNVTSVENSKQSAIPSSTSTMQTTTKEPDSILSVPPVKKYGVKYLTWSRNFDFKPFIVENSNKPCPKRDLSTHLTFN